MAGPEQARVGAVAIGRNEGIRLKRCLESLVSQGAAIVYVDSGSTDDSVSIAKALGVHVVELDATVAFTAARARNAGFELLVKCEPDVREIQFVDGDCEVAPGWLKAAVAELDRQPSVAIVCGRRKERAREATVYNRLCDMDWNRPIGIIRDTCGGDALVRRAVFEEVGGYRESMIAGEDPELCVRVRAKGHQILRLDREMTYHDAAMTRFSQWWRRTRRSGWAYAAGAHLHGSLLGGHNVRSVIRAVGWGIVIPSAAVASLLASIWNPWMLGVLACIAVLYLLVTIRTLAARRRSGDRWSDSLLYAVFCVLGKPAEAAGVMLFWSQQLRRRGAELIEYK